MNEIKDICRLVQKWMDKDKGDRALMILMTELKEDGPHLAMTGGGDRELLVASLCELMDRQPEMADAVREAVDIIRAREAELN